MMPTKTPSYPGMMFALWALCLFAAGMDAGLLARAFEARQEAAGAKIDISGAWEFAVETDAGGGNPSFTFEQDGEKVAGTYKGLFGTAELTGMLRGKDLHFSFEANYGGQEFTVTYSGVVEGPDSMKGTVQLGDLGEGTWTAKRAPR